MRLLASTDFALRVLMLLAGAPVGTRMSVETLARELGGLSRNHLHKIVQDLADYGVAVTTRGAGGGVALAVAPDKIRLGKLIRHLESDQPIVECFREEGCACTLMPDCRLRGMLSEASDGFYTSLDKQTLADCLATKPELRPGRRT
jgi:Rrf2 family nitric oxide-sensitive transcriptional repressor